MGCERCPVCTGKGIVSNGFYRSTNQQWNTTSASPQQCRSCLGYGIVWNITLPNSKNGNQSLSNVRGKWKKN